MNEPLTSTVTLPAAYLDNASTTYPKPDIVYQAVDNYLRESANPSRGQHGLALHSTRAIFEARLLMSGFLGIKEPERLIFTGSCTQSINMALKGFGLKRGDIVVTSALEHNAVMRPLRQLENQLGIRICVMPYAEEGVIDPAELDAVLTELKPRLVILCEASNVTGQLLDMRKLAGICRDRDVPLMVDAAQSLPWSHGYISDLGVSLWCASSHKGLYGIPGAGLLYIGPDIDLEPLICGGTGSRSESYEMPDVYPDRMESGTLPGPAIISMAAGVSWLVSERISNICAQELWLAERFLEWAEASDFVRVYGPGSGGVRVGIVAFSVRGVTPSRVADLLQEKWNIAVRAGLQCSALAHQTLGTISTGLVRASFGYFNTADQVDLLCEALTAIYEDKVAKLGSA